MARKTQEELRIQKLVDAAFRKVGHGIPINVFDIGTILDAGRTAGVSGGQLEIETAMSAAFAKYGVRI